MRLGTLWLAAAALAASAADFAHADDMVARGAGVLSCEEIVSNHAQGAGIDNMTAWIYGFWSAENIRRGETGLPPKNIGYSTVDPEPLEAQLLAICRESPTIFVKHAADRVFEVLPEIRE